MQALGLQTAQGLVLTYSFYWDLNERTRAFSGRVAAHGGAAQPTMVQAGCYGAALHYLKAAAALGQAEARRSAPRSSRA